MSTKAESLRTVAHDGAARKIANNTWEYHRDESRFIRLHNTEIIEFKPDGRVVLNSGGWRTVTTKARFNRFTPYGVYQKNHEWFVLKPRDPPHHWHRDGAIPFYDGMVLPDAFKEEN